MSGRLKVFFGILLAGVAAMLAYKFALPRLINQSQKATSDAAQIRETVRIGTDSWIGYFPLCSPHLRQLMTGGGVLIRCEDDGADLEKRLKALHNGDLDLAVFSLDSYLLLGQRHDYPGTIVAVLDESRGGDALVARKDKLATLDALKTGGFRMTYVPGSPSEFLIRTVGVHFDVPALRARDPATVVKASGAGEALKLLRDGKADLAGLWEPEVSRATADGRFTVLLSTRDTRRLIVDVLVARRGFAREASATVHQLLSHYFRTLRHYREQPDALAGDLKAATNLGDEPVKAMLDGVAWQNLQDNARLWYGIGSEGREGLIAAIDGVVDVLRQSGESGFRPFGDGNPYVILNRSFVGELHDKGLADTATSTDAVRSFAVLPPDQWRGLREIGTLKTRPIPFQSGSDTFVDEAEGALDETADHLRHYPNFRILVKGHTATGGDEAANVGLSRTRAEAVRDYLVRNHRIEENRIHAEGYGSSAPLARKPGESDRAYQYRLPRVEVVLVTEVF